MIIRSKSEVKTLLQVSVSTYDTIIAALLPIVSEYIIDYTHNKFKDDIYHFASTISFDSEDGTISDSDSGFIDADLTNADYVCIEGSLDNDGIYRVATVEEDTITLHDEEVSLKDEEAGEGVYVWKVVIPQPLQLLFAQMIKYDYDTRDKSVSAESLGDHSITYGGTVHGYSEGIIKRLNSYRMLSWQ